MKKKNKQKKQYMNKPLYQECNFPYIQQRIVDACTKHKSSDQVYQWKRSIFFMQTKFLKTMNE